MFEVRGTMDLLKSNRISVEFCGTKQGPISLAGNLKKDTTCK